MKRITANSENLKKTFPKVYEDLFSKSSVVVSAPGSFWWCGEYSNTQGGICFLQKLPQRVYCGFTEEKVSRFLLEELKYYLPNSQKFIVTNLEDPLKSKLEKFLNDEFSNILPSKIKILSEIRPGSGLNFSGALACALVIGMNLRCKYLTFEEIQSWTEMPTSKLLKNSKFVSTFRKAWKIQNLFHADSSSGATAFVPLIPTIYPVIYLTEQRSGSFGNNKLTRLPRDLKGHLEITDKIQFSGARFEEIFPLSEKPSWPVDFYLIFSGDTRTTEDALRAIRYHKERIAQLPRILQDMPAKIEFDNQSDIPKIYNFLKFKYPKEKLWEKFTDELVVANLVMLALMRLLFEGGMDLETLKLLFWNINNHQRFLAALGVSSPTIDRICQILLSEVKTVGDLYGTAAKITGAGKKGDILFVTIHNGPRNQIELFVKKLRRQIDKNIYLDYASWIDGIEDKGVLVEQHLKEKIYSDYISEGAMQIKKVSPQGTVTTELSTFEQFQSMKNTFELLLDKVEGVIYIKGQPVNSKNIPSSKTTIKVLSILIDKIGKEVSAKTFGKNSYFEDRNAFQGKIITPLLKTLKKRLNKKLNLTLSGSLDNFTVKFEPSPLTIGLVEKVF